MLPGRPSVLHPCNMFRVATKESQGTENCLLALSHMSTSIYIYIYIYVYTQTLYIYIHTHTHTHTIYIYICFFTSDSLYKRFELLMAENIKIMK
jgi:hypothetical protein